MKNKTFLANCALVLCAVIWGMNFIFQKQASQHLGAFTFISLRYYLGVLSLLPLFSICAAARPSPLWRPARR